MLMSDAEALVPTKKYPEVEAIDGRINGLVQQAVDIHTKINDDKLPRLRTTVEGDVERGRALIDQAEKEAEKGFGIITSKSGQMAAVEWKHEWHLRFLSIRYSLTDDLADANSIATMRA